MRHENWQAVVDEIARLGRDLGRIQLMEVCGTHTVSLFRSGIRSVLPSNIELVSGPGCPVCVTSQGYIDVACQLAAKDEVIICTYGDMMRVPGRGTSLETQRAKGAQVHVVYSARDAVRTAQRNPDRTVVFLAVGFETTAPATAAIVLEADKLGLGNLLVLTAHKRVVPAMEALLKDGDIPIDGFLCPGHVSVVTGFHAYEVIVGKYGKPCVVAGFEPSQMLDGIRGLLRQIRGRQTKLENVYPVAVSATGNDVAQRMLRQVFVVATTAWRALGGLPGSGLELAPEFERFDALKRFSLTIGPDYDPPGCRCGEVIQGKLKPSDCALFAEGCTPMAPIGPCMVSSEGTCAAWYKYYRPSPQAAPQMTLTRE
ncbi:MAG: hydrogenase formation protein HypD [Planctomycetota bacterium]